jgi:hypothetical protein
VWIRAQQIEGERLVQAKALIGPIDDGWRSTVMMTVTGIDFDASGFMAALNASKLSLLSVTQSLTIPKSKALMAYSGQRSLSARDIAPPAQRPS